ncbi:MAG: DUF488 family protein [Bacteroidetes bacterium]|nr:DUF488 family protein [Bacteroidota bacterium]MBS1632822.1 DUF488 family protein [Bacteroidota bacterium]
MKLLQKKDGYRLSVDRHWPGGVSKEKAKLDECRKELGLSDKLRQWFNHKHERFTIKY